MFKYFALLAMPFLFLTSCTQEEISNPNTLVPELRNSKPIIVQYTDGNELSHLLTCEKVKVSYVSSQNIKIISFNGTDSTSFQTSAVTINHNVESMDVTIFSGPNHTKMTTLNGILVEAPSNSLYSVINSNTVTGRVLIVEETDGF